MGKFEGIEKIGLRDKKTGKLKAVYPYKPEGADDEIIKAVRDWYYQQNCSAEDELLNLKVDFLTDNEIKSQN
ncbi:MAG: hypothetical protein Q8900_11450 [Bacillota bacterium]|nr:hypothetical protein [Bacillota bacterium]